MARDHDRKSRSDSGAGAGIRRLRLQRLFREELNSVLDGELRDRRLDGVRITLVELAPDGSTARVWFATTGNDDPLASRAAGAALARAAGFLRHRLCDALPLKRVPELRFRYDASATHAAGDDSPEGPTRAGDDDQG